MSLSEFLASLIYDENYLFSLQIDALLLCADVTFAQCGDTQREREGDSPLASLLINALFLSDQDPTLTIIFNLNYFLRVSSSKYSYAGGQGFNIRICGGHANVQFIIKGTIFLAASSLQHLLAIFGIPWFVDIPQQLSIFTWHFPQVSSLCLPSKTVCICVQISFFLFLK